MDTIRATYDNKCYYSVYERDYHDKLALCEQYVMVNNII